MWPAKSTSYKEESQKQRQHQAEPAHLYGVDMHFLFYKVPSSAYKGAARMKSQDVINPWQLLTQHSGCSNKGRSTRLTRG